MNVNKMIMPITLKHPLTLFTLSFGVMSLFLLTAVYVGWQWNNDWSLAHEEVVVKVAATHDETAAMIAAIPQEHLFGKAFAKSGNVPLTNLGLRVTGIVKTVFERNSVSKAYISISGQPGKIYQVGDQLPYGVKVYEITANAVILDNHGRLEKLVLPREKLQFKLRNSKEL